MPIYYNMSAGAATNIGENRHLLRLVQAFSKYFRTNRAEVRDAQRFSLLYLLPNKELAEQFSLTREILCFSDDASKCDSRSFEIIETILKRESTRLLDDAVFFISEAANAEALCSDYMERSGRKVIYCSWRDIEAAHEDFSYELLRQFLYNRDFFDISDPVSSDAQFFGRFKLVDEIFDELSGGQNCGIFGLRKSGKTSVIQRFAKRNAIANKFRIAVIDAQSPEIYANNAGGVALEICREFNRGWARAYGSPFEKNIPKDLSLIESSQYFREFAHKLLGQNQPLLVIFDELERILPNHSRSSVWNTEYIDLWRLLRSETQTKSGKFVFLVASTNPYFIESAKFGTEDNPIYRFIKPFYLPMFSLHALSEMLRKLGKPMGVTFSDEALSLIHSEFGGHPFLSRQLCSAIAKDLETRPLGVEEKHVKHSIERHRSSFYEDMKSILKIFSDFYPDERRLLDELHRDERGALSSLKEQPMAAKHLLGYGLVHQTKNSYRFSMDALPVFLEAAEVPEFKQPDLPEASQARHLELQAAMNIIEPALRVLIVAQLRSKFGGDWVGELKLQESSQNKIEVLNTNSSQAIMEETFLNDLIGTILNHWKLFERIFEPRNTFREQSAHLVDIARKVSDHRKFQICEDDAKFIRASEACKWFIERIG